MKKLLIILYFCALVLVNASSSSSSSSSCDEDETSSAVESSTGLPSEIRRRSSTEAAQLVSETPSNPFVLEKSLTTPSIDQTAQTQTLYRAFMPHQRSFARFVLSCLPSAEGSTLNQPKLISPRNSPVIFQLNLIDGMLATQFSLASEPKTFMAGHLNILGSHCRRLASQLGPLHAKSRNCAFRFNELSRFVGLLSKYNIDVSRYLGKAQVNFCSHFIPAINKLNNFINFACTEYESVIVHREDTSLSAELDELKGELKMFEEALDAFDLDMLHYCDGSSTNQHSLSLIREALYRFLQLAFI